MSYLDGARTDQPLPLPDRPGIKSRIEAPPQWFAFQTVPQREMAAADAMRDRGYPSFVPVEYKQRRKSHRSRKYERVAYPMFRGYIFAQVDSQARWDELKNLHTIIRKPGKASADGARIIDRLSERRVVVGVVTFNGRPAPIAEKNMHMLMQLSGQTIPHKESVNPRKSFDVGDKVLITSGPFAGFKQVTIEAISKRHAMVFLNLFNTVSEVKVPLEHLRVA